MRKDLQATEHEHAEHNDLLRTFDLQSLEVWHGKKKDNEVHREVSSDCAGEPLPVIDATSRILDAFIPVCLHRETV